MWVWKVAVPGAYKGLANGGEGILVGAGFDLESLAEATLPCPFSKSLKDVNLFFWTKAVEVGIKTGPNEHTPMTPVTLALHVIHFHDAIGNVPVCSTEKTFPMVAVLRWHMSQDVLCGRGKVELKCERNSWSLGNVSNECNAKSAMWLSAPGRWKAVSGVACHASIQRASTWSSCEASQAFDARRHDAHATAGVLSHPTATWQCARSANGLSISH